MEKWAPPAFLTCQRQGTLSDQSRHGSALLPRVYLSNAPEVTKSEGHTLGTSWPASMLIMLPLSSYPCFRQTIIWLSFSSSLLTSSFIITFLKDYTPVTKINISTLPKCHSSYHQWWVTSPNGEPFFFFLATAAACRSSWSRDRTHTTAHWILNPLCHQETLQMANLIYHKNTVALISSQRVTLPLNVKSKNKNKNKIFVGPH